MVTPVHTVPTLLQTALAKDLPAKQKQIMGEVYFKSADANNLQARLIEEVEDIKKGLLKDLALDVKLLNPGKKSEKSARAKVQKAQYGGDWDLAKDLARCTLVVEKASDIERAFNYVKEHFSYGRKDLKPVPGVSFAQAAPRSLTRNRLIYHSERVFKPESDPCGYSGYTVFVASGGANANKAEIQVNSVTMMFAKSEEEFVNEYDEDKQRELMTKYPQMPPFLGHLLYERATRPAGVEKTPDGQAYAAACKAYYNYFRSDPPNMFMGVRAHEALSKLSQVKPPLNIVLPSPPALVAPKGWGG